MNNWFPMLFPPLTHRSAEPELMDDAEALEEKVHRTLGHLRMINAVLSRSRMLIQKILLPHMARQHREVSVLDLGAGGCDLALWLARQCRNQNVPIRMTCLDNNPSVLSFAAEKITGWANISLVQGNALDRHGSLQQGFDYVFANHFLHHLDDADVSGLLSTVHAKARCGFLLNDLRRSPAAYAAFGLAGMVFGSDSITYRDGLTSIRRGFQEEELRATIARLELPDEIKVGTAFPAWFYLFCLKDP